MQFEVYEEWNSLLTTQWRWRLRAPNGNIIADSAEGYYNQADCLRGIEIVMGTTPTTPICRR